MIKRIRNLTLLKWLFRLLHRGPIFYSYEDLATLFPRVAFVLLVASHCHDWTIKLHTYKYRFMLIGSATNFNWHTNVNFFYYRMFQHIFFFWQNWVKKCQPFGKIKAIKAKILFWNQFIALSLLVINFKPNQIPSFPWIFSDNHFL